MSDLNLDAASGAALGAPFSPFLRQFERTCENLALGLVSARVRTRALLELLEEKGVFGEGEFDARASAIWERDYESLAAEILTPPEEPAPAPSLPGSVAEEAAPAAAPSAWQVAERHYAAVLADFVDDAVAARVRLRAILELLEAAGVLAEGEFDRKAEAIWDRDYEELALEFYRATS